MYSWVGWQKWRAVYMRVLSCVAIHTAERLAIPTCILLIRRYRLLRLQHERTVCYCAIIASSRGFQA